MFLRKLRGTEYLYAYASSSADILSRTGYIGHLRCDFGASGKEFWMFPSQWYEKKYPEKFSETLDYVVNSLRGIEKGFDKKNQILKDRTSMQKFIDRRANEEYLLPNSTEKYGARVDCENFTFIIRINFYPQSGDYNAYIHCYITYMLEAHINRSSKGIRFITSKYKDLFRIPDGGRIIITEPNGKFHSENCRYIDDYHFKAGRNIFHICEFAEIMEKNGNTVTPAGEVL